ncbi:MAG TPA: NAD(+)/NADH kinase, partial [Solirubrobacteraceae bacterium]
MMRAVVFTHRRPEETRWALDKLIAAAADLGVELRFDPEETRKHALSAGDGVVVDGSDDIEGVDLVVVL